MLNSLNPEVLVLCGGGVQTVSMTQFAEKSRLSSGEDRRSQSCRAVLALNEKEMDLFFPKGFAPGGLEVAHYRGGWDAEAFWEDLQRHEAELVVTCWSTPPFQEEWRETLSSLRYVCHVSGAVRNLLPRVYLEEGLLVTNWGNLAAANVAEHALLLLLAGLRRLSEWPSVIAGKRPWQPSPIVTRTLFGKRVGLHGFGNVAQSLSRLLKPFGVEISAYSEGVPEGLFGEFGVSRADSLEALFEGNEIVVECEALNPRTQGVVTREVLERLPTGALFVNVGRGAVVDEQALSELSAAGHIGVALDVFDTDPIRPDSPLHDLEDAVLSPHIAGPTSDQFARCGELAVRNIEAYLEGSPLEAQVSLEIYDRAT
ncbi:hydroxyacid dehydrogenase [Puniceicoccus vermicola]|uniref:Hydroxyacid dehydrogenase n=1 Tax=Puniceicoccus vermicola TaxID=388746 RepID=A0A7X1B178_9BACT|nr:hydroxyacid dehydrogenase [Puniceicoccus vermicola]MBC2603719.1 hydroxyacid dehydrogenase [Puniceicoccus vermicola]